MISIIGGISMLKLLNEKNEVEIYSVHDERFKFYGRVVKGYDLSQLISYVENKTIVPEEGNVYYPSIKELEETKVYESIKRNLYGGSDIQIGYCNGRNSKLNGFEYHKCSEVNIAVTDFVLILGHTWDINRNTYNVKNAQFFYVRKGEAIEMYQTTLHLSPCKVSDDGFKGIVVLDRGTNTPLEYKKNIFEPIDLLLLKKNKWIIAHPDREPLIKQGAFPGIIGENIEVFYK
jgi:hypothetical protein